MTYAHKITTALVLLTCLFNYLSGITAQSTTWEGDVNDSWFTAGNWTNGVPDATTEAIIASVAPGNQNCVIDQLSGTARKVTIQPAGQLTVQAGAPALTITVSDGDQGIDVASTGGLSIGGTINIVASGSNAAEGLVNRGTVDITGNLNVNGMTKEGILNLTDGTVNLDGGRISIDNIGDQGISIDNGGTITNEGTITVTRTNDDEEAFVNRDSLINRGTINLTRGSVGLRSEGGSRLLNEVGGVINTTNCLRGVELFTAVFNDGTFTINGGDIGFSARRGFENNRPGIIQVDGTAGPGFKAQSNNSFLNFGTIALGVNTAIADTAMIVNVRGGSGNYGAGEITIGSGTEGLVVLRANFENRAALNIDNTVNEAIKIATDAGLFAFDDTIAIGDNSPTGGGIINNGNFIIGPSAAIRVRTTSSVGIQVNDRLNNNGILFTNQALLAGDTSRVSGSGSFELQGDWNCTGETDIGGAELIMSGTNPSSITNTQEPLEVAVLFADETDGVLTLNSELLINEELNLSEGTLDLNGQVVTLAETANLVGESETTYVFDSEGSGAGFLTHTRAVNNQNNLSPAGLGVTLFTPNDLGDLTIRRRHYTSVGGTAIVNRTYEVFYTSPEGALSLRFTYLDRELGSINESDLEVFTVENGSLTEVSATSFDPANNTIEYEDTLINAQFAFAAIDRLLTWTGAISEDWFTAGNWEPQVIPTADFDVVIPEVTTNDPIISATAGNFARVRSIVVEANASLTNDLFLDVDGALDTAIVVSGTFTNNANLLVFDAGAMGIYVAPTGTFTNTGNLRHDRFEVVGGDFLQNAGAC
ncbi:MAG: hypothetical protein AAGJ82_05735, partial [Bacteroidota bacterium]